MDRSLRNLVERHERGSTHKFLFYNTWLLNVPIDSEDKPAIEERCREIGRALDRDGYDIMGLCEVFDESERDAIRREFSRPIESRMGPDQALQESSGLQTIVAGNRSIVYDHVNEYDDQGGWFEADYHATKGILYTEIDLAPNDDESMHLDLYTTHTHAVNERSRRNQIAELAAFVARTAQPRNVAVITGDLNVDFRRDEYSDLLRTLSQIEIPLLNNHGHLENLYRYVEEHRTEIAERLLKEAGADAKDIAEAIGEGDIEEVIDSAKSKIKVFLGVADAAGVSLPFDPFNADARTIADHFGWQVDTNVIEFDNLWLVRGGRAGATAEIQNYDSVCALDSEHSPDGYHYCQDYAIPKIRDSKPSDSIPGYRLDYVFLQTPVDHHTFNLDTMRIRRRPFWRSEDPDVGYLDPTVFSHQRDGTDFTPGLDLPSETVPHFMSDHIGLEVMFIASPSDSEYRTRQFE